MRMLDSDGVAVLRGGDVVRDGHSPFRAGSAAARGMAARQREGDGVRPTESLGRQFDLAEDDRALAAGVLALTLFGD
jgi:light-regulated signal transduction histidine kinase (bacteriophytochrome)